VIGVYLLKAMHLHALHRRHDADGRVALLNRATGELLVVRVVDRLIDRDVHIVECDGVVPDSFAAFLTPFHRTPAAAEGQPF
jgi:hypothetical protein